MQATGEVDTQLQEVQRRKHQQEISISPSSEYSGLISFKLDWFDILADKGTLKSLL